MGPWPDEKSGVPWHTLQFFHRAMENGQFYNLLDKFIDEFPIKNGGLKTVRCFF